MARVAPYFARVMSAPPGPPPPPSGPPETLPDAYRNDQPYLFGRIDAATIPDRIGGTAFPIDNASYSPGPTRTYVDQSGWPWDNAGGDWLDANLVRMGTTPWASVATAATSPTTYNAIDVTAALRMVKQLARWNAWIVTRSAGAAARHIGGRFNATAGYRPSISVTYTDSTTATLACRVSAFLGGGTSTPLQTDPAVSMNTATATGEIALEFDMPTKPVASATMSLTVTNDWGGTATLNLYLADPPLNFDSVVHGVAQGYPLDAGLSGHASIIGQHRYHDGSVLSDYVSSTVFDTEDPNSFSPDLTGGVADTNKLPYKDLGKWIGGAGFYGNTPQVVSSSYSGNGFAALASGMGALRVEMPKASGITDGWEGGQGGTGAANVFIYLPAAKLGFLRRLFVRYYMRIGVTADTGNPYSVGVDKKYQVLKLGAPTWTDMAGKCGIGGAHKTRSGGNSGTAGGGHGWSLRREFGDTPYSANSPSDGGWGLGWSFTDYQGNNVIGHRYGSSNPLTRAQSEPSQRGGLGARMYANRWYCIEEEIYLNSVAVASGAGDGKNWTPDGYVRMWVDGRKVFDTQGLVFRSLPLENSYPSLMGTVREVGHAHLWFNWFHGGLTQNSIDRVIFISGLAWGESYIGPMAGVYPSWRAA